MAAPEFSTYMSYDDRDDISLDPITRLPVAEEDNTTFMLRTKAYMALVNPIFRRKAQGPRIDYPPDEDYYSLDDPQTKDYDPRRFIDSKSAGQTGQIVEDIEFTRHLQSLAHGFSEGLIGTVLGYAANPLIVVPALLTGGSNLPAMIAADTTAEIVNESFLHSRQPERTRVESTINAATAGLGTLGVTLAARKFFAIKANAQRKFVEHAIDEPKKEFITPEDYETLVAVEPKKEFITDEDFESLVAVEPTIKPTGEGTGAAIVIPPKFQEEGIVSVPYANLVRVLGGTKISTASDLVVNAGSNLTKQATRDLAEVSIRVEGPATTAVETSIKKADGLEGDMEFFAQEEFALYRKNGGDLKRAGFDELVSVAMRNGDTHPNKQVQAVARQKRQPDQDLFDQANALKMYGDSPPKLKGSRSHLQRIFVREKVLAERSRLKRLILSKIGRDEVFVVRLDEPGSLGVFGLVDPQDWPALKIQHGGDIRIAVGEDTDMVADNIIDNIMGQPGQYDYVGAEHSVPKAGSLHERTLGFMTDNELSFVLENNSARIMEIYVRQMTRSIEMTKKFGDIDMRKTFKAIREDQTRLLNEAKTDKERVKLGKRFKKDNTRLKGLRDKVLGTYGRPDDPTSWFVTLPRVARLGALVSQGMNIPMSSVSDIVAPALRYGLKPFYHGMKVLLSGQGKAYKRYVQHLGIAVESVTNARGVAIADTAFATKWERQGHKWFGRISGLNLFTDVTQSMNAVSTSSMWLGWMKNWAKVSDGNKAKLLDMGIDDGLAKRINDQITIHGKKRNGVTLPNSHLWKDDLEAATAFENALRKETHTTSLVPGKGDAPLAMGTETGRFFGMFLSFITSAHSKFLIAGLQRHDADFLTGMLITTVAGMMTAAGKNAIRGRDITDKEMHQWVMDGMDRAGTLAWLMPPVNKIRALAMEDMPSRYAARRDALRFFEPAPAGWGIDIYSSAVGAVQGNTNDQWRFVRALPYVNALHAVDLLQTTTGGRK